jgi:glutaminase
VLHVGDSTESFSIQSMSKLFSLCALLRRDADAWRDVG